jgi:hypothetical protein
MPRRTLAYLRSPFRYPEWGEMILAILGLTQFGLATVLLSDLVQRPAYTLTLWFGPEAWAIAGLLLCIMHMAFISMNNTKLKHRIRVIAAGSSLVFWVHFILSQMVYSLVFGSPFPLTLVPSLGTPLLAGAVLFRLWRNY